jgi:hypothetical protein
MADKRRVEIGFAAGQSVAVQLPDETLEQLAAALRDRHDGWSELQGIDGRVLIDLRAVVYVKVDDDSRIGRTGFASF